MARVVPVIEALQKEPWFREGKIIISVDTWKSEVAEKALVAGAHLINDVTSGRDPKMFGVVAKHRVPIILMHSRGDPQTMSQLAEYTKGNVLATVAQELSDKLHLALQAVLLHLFSPTKKS